MYKSDAAPEASTLWLAGASLLRRANTIADRIVSGRTWQIKALLAVLAISLLRAFPYYQAVRDPGVQNFWRAALIKVDDPLADMARRFPADSHESKLTFRLTVPILARALHLRRTGLMIVFALANILLLHGVLTVAYRTTGSRRTALYMCLATACVWAGMAGFHELRGGFYDSVALCLLILSLNASSPTLVGIYAFAAAWTDERALVTLPMILVFSIVASTSRVTVRRVLLGKGTAILLAMVAYCASRMYLTTTRSLLVSSGGVGTALLTAFPFSDPLAILTALGGSWLMVVLGLVVLLVKKRYWMAAAFCGALVPIIGAALCVADRTRSLAYCLPAVFVGMSIISRSEPEGNVEGLAVLCCLISFIVPTYYFEAKLYWISSPLPVQGLRWIVHYFRPS
jgi:hypothetical protein